MTAVEVATGNLSHRPLGLVFVVAGAVGLVAGGLLGAAGALLVELDDFGNVNYLEASQVTQEAVPTGIFAFVFIGLVATVVRGFLQRHPTSSVKSYVTLTAIVAAGVTAAMLAAVYVSAARTASEAAAASSSGSAEFLLRVVFLVVVAALSGLTAALAAVATR